MENLLAIGALLLACAVSVLADTPTPYWHNHFSVDFNETTKAVFWQWQTEGTWYYNAKTNQELVYRENGRGDRFCKSIHPFSDTPCTHLITDGNRYLIFPDLGSCCFCCNAEHGCGILDPHWLDDAEYQGLVPVAGTEAYKWSKKGLQPNYYYTTPDVVQAPVELDQIPIDFQTFHVDTFNPSPPDPAVFTLPDGCDQPCPTASTCGVLRGTKGTWSAAAAVAAGVAVDSRATTSSSTGQMREGGTSQSLRDKLILVE